MNMQSSYVFSPSTPQQQARGVWVCQNCSRLNMSQLSRCVSCDCINPARLSPYQQQPTIVPSGVQQQQQLGLRLSSSPFRGTTQYTPRMSPSMPTSPPSSIGVATMTTQTPQTNTQLFCDSVIASRPPTGRTPLQQEQHTQVEWQQQTSPPATEPQHNNSEPLPSPAVANNLAVQLENAVAAHSALLKEYETRESSQRQQAEELSQTTKKLEELQRKLEAKEQSDREASALKVRELAAEKEALRARIEELQFRHTFHESSNDENSRLQSTMSSLEHSNALLRDQVQELTNQCEATKREAIKQQLAHADEMQAVMKETLDKNSSVMRDLATARGEMQKFFEMEKDALHVQIVELRQRLAAEEKSHAAAKEEWEKQYREFKEEAARLQTQRDELLSEAKFQLEINSEQMAEKAALRAEVATLRSVLATTGADARHTPSRLEAPSRPSAANVSHGSSVAVEVSAATAELRRELEIARAEIQLLRTSLESEKEAAAKATADQQREGRDRDGSIGGSDSGPSELKLQALQIGYDELQTELASLKFECNEVKKQLAGTKEKLRLRDLDVEELEENISQIERSLETERGFGDKARKDLEEMEQKANEQIAEWKRKVDSLTREITESSKENQQLVEKCEAAEIAMNDMNETLAELLFQQQQQQQKGTVSA